MVDLYNALAGNFGDESDYLKQDPFYMAGAGVSGWKLPRAQTNAEAIFGPAFQGLLSGALLGYGKDEANTKAYNDIQDSPLLKSLSEDDTGKLSTDYLGVDKPDGWDVKKGKSDLLLAALAADTQQKKEVQRDESERQLTNILAQHGAQKDDTGQVVAIPGLSTIEATASAEKAKADAEAKGTIEKAVKSKDASIAANGGIESMDRLLKMVDTLPDSMVGRTVEGLSPITNATNFFDDQAHSVSAALAKQLEGRVNETVLKSYLESMARHEGDSKDDVKSRIVNAQLWLSRIAQGDTKALNLDPAEFAKARGVDPAKIGIDSVGGSGDTGGSEAPAPPPGYELTGNKDANGNYGIRKIR